jgi:putative alpha-1,2-mannosidase
MYKTGPDGLAGNDDCGQMSAWYIWTCLGMYPMNPASGEYVFGFPLVKNATIQLPGSKKLQIKVVKSANEKLPGIQMIKWNGKVIPVQSIKHTTLMKGGVLEYYINK